MKKHLAFLCGITVVFLFVFYPATELTAQSYDLIHQFDSESTLRVQTQFQYSGSVIVDGAGNEENERALPLDVRASLKFDQRISSSSKRSPQAIRFFEEAKAQIDAGKGSTQTELSDSNRLVIARMHSPGNDRHTFEIASIDSKLSQKEYELLKTPGDALAFANLFNRKDVKVGDQWKAGKEFVADLVSVNRIITCDISMMLKSVDAGVARIYLFGDLKGEVDDAITNMKVKGIALLDINEKLIESFRLTIDEERRSGQFAPGFEGKIKLDSRLTKTGNNPRLSKQRMAKSYRGKKVKFDFRLEPEDSEFTLDHSKQWRVIASQKDAAVLRYIDDGQLIAQCNIVELPRRPADNPLSLDDFKQEISRITSSSEGAEISDTGSLQTANGLKSIYVNVDGFEQGIPFKWLYYHVAANDGRRVTFVFTLEKETEDYFGSADRQLINGFQFHAARSASRGKTRLRRKHTRR